MLYLTPLLPALCVVMTAVYALRASRTRSGWREITCFGFGVASLAWLPIFLYVCLGASHFFATGNPEHFPGMPTLQAASVVQVLLSVIAGAFPCFGWLGARSASTSRSHPA